MEQLQHNALHPKPAALNLERLMDAWCCYFLAAGLLAAIFKLLAPGPAYPGDFLYWPLFFLLIVCFYNRPLLIALGACAVIFLFFSIIGDAQWLREMREFISWCANDYSPANANFVYRYYATARLLLSGGVTIGLWLLIRRRAPFWLLLAACPALVALLAYFGWRGFSVSMYLLAAGLLPLAASSTVSRSARGRAASYALPLTALIISVALVVLPADTGGWRWQPLGDKVEEWREAARVYYWGWRTRNEPLAAFDLAEEYHARLGGPINPGNTRMLLVTASESLLLKGSVYDLYTGHGWEKSASLSGIPSAQGYISPSAFSISADAIPFLPESAEAENELNEILGFIPQPESDHPLAPFARQFSAEITLLHPQEPRLFYGGRPQSFSSAENTVPFVEQGAELKSQLPLYNGYRYELTGLTLDRSQAGFAAAVTAAARQGGIPERIPSAAQDNTALQLPNSLLADDSFTAYYFLTREIVNEGLAEGETRGPYEQALLLESWLKNSCRYTLNPQMPPEEVDFALHFFNTREGYCTYYATAMVVMARMLNIRARYVTGYSLRPLAGENQYEATQATAHAWTELYFDGVGWLPFDPTGYADYTESSARSDYGSDEVEREFLGGAGPERPAGASRSLWAAALALVVVALALIILILKRAGSAYRLPKLLIRFSPAAVLEIYYRDLQGQLNMLGWQRRPAETIIAFARRMGSYLPRQERQLRELAAVVCAWRYGELPPQQDSLLEAASLHEHFEGILRRQLKGGRYYLYRLRHWPAQRAGGAGLIFVKKNYQLPIYK